MPLKRNPHDARCQAGDNKDIGPALLERVLQLQGDFRRRLEPIGLTPLQAGMILYLDRHVHARLKDTSAALGVQLPTLDVVINDLVRKHWMIKRRAIHDDRALCLRLSQQKDVLARSIKDHVQQVRSDLISCREV